MTKKELSELGQVCHDIKEIDKKVDVNFTKMESEITALRNELSDSNTKFEQLKEEVKKSLEVKPNTTYAATPQPDKRKHITIDLNTPDNLKSGLIIALWIFLAVMFVLILFQNAKISALQGIQ